MRALPKTLAGHRRPPSMAAGDEEIVTPVIAAAAFCAATAAVRRSRGLATAAVGAVALISAVGFAQSSAPREERFADWTRPVFPADEYSSRRKLLLAGLSSGEVLLVPGAEGTSAGENFRQLDDFEYFVGLEVPRSLLAMDGRTKRSLLFVPRRDPRFDNPGRPNDFPGRPLALDAALPSLSGVDSVLSDDQLPAYLVSLARQEMQVLLNLSGAGRPDVNLAPMFGTPMFGTPMFGTPMFGTPTSGETLASHLQRHYPTLSLANGFARIATLRMVKSSREIASMRRAARITGDAIARGAARVRAGIDERTLTGAFLADCMALGAQGVPFTPIVKSGVNSLWPWRILGSHYDRRNRVMRPGELVIYDVGCEFDHYASDVGRTFPVSGTFTPRQRELVEMVRRISDAVIAAARPGLTLADLQRVALSTIPETARPYMQAPLYFGHHLGLDSGDPFISDARLTTGMIFTIEPWYYNHDEGVAVFIEDEILITNTGSENLTAALPRSAKDLERWPAPRRRPTPSAP